MLIIYSTPYISVTNLVHCCVPVSLLERWSTQRANDKDKDEYKDHLDGQLTTLTVSVSEFMKVDYLLLDTVTFKWDSWHSGGYNSRDA